MHMKIDFWGLLIGIIIILGLVGPWITKGYNSYPKINPETKQGELHFHKYITISPIYARLYENGELIDIFWFTSSGITLAGLMLLSTAILFAIKVKIRWFKLSVFLIAFCGIIIFFMSFGTGLGIGLRTNFGWGLLITFIGVVLMFAQSINDLIKNTSISVSSSY